MASDKIIRFSDENFNPFLLKSRVPVLVDFWAPMLKRLAEEYDGQIAFGSVNVEECPRTVKEFRISSVPTLTLLVDGITEQRLIGLRPIEELRSLLGNYARRNDRGESVSNQDS